MVVKMKQATLHIDLDSILYNYRHLKCYYKKKVIAVLKDDAYGVVLIQVANTIKYEEGLIIAVSDIDEIIKLRKNGYGGELLYLNVFDITDIETIKRYNVIVCVSSIEQLNIVKKYNIRFHLKVNCGMNRLGLYGKDIFKAIDLINNGNNYLIEGVMSHFANNDEDHKSYYLFEKYVKLIKKENLIIHCFASSSLNENFDNITTHIRVGLKLYGIGERESFLHYALRLTSPIIAINKISKNQMVGYDYKYKTMENGYLIILPIGYGKGLYRFNNSIVYASDTYLKQAGKISMDYSTYFSLKNIDKSEEIELFGKKVPIEILCKINNISAHEVLVNLKVIKKYSKIKIDN